MFRVAILVTDRVPASVLLRTVQETVEPCVILDALDSVVDQDGAQAIVSMIAIKFVPWVVCVNAIIIYHVERRTHADAAINYVVKTIVILPA